MSWLDVQPEELDSNPELQQQRQQDHFSVLYGSPAGRRVMAYLRRRVYNPGPIDSLAVMARIELYEELRHLCGVNDDLKVIEAEASSAELEKE
jgi:hypothetical protein